MSRVEREKRVVACMVRMYCRAHHGTRGYGEEVSSQWLSGKPKITSSHEQGLCAECAELVSYACARIDACPHGSDKSTCRLCVTHCYAPSKREAIRRVMRYAGPRMLLHHPIMTLRHLLAEMHRERGL